MSATIYHNPDCGTSPNVIALIRNTGEEPRIIEYLKTPPSRDELKGLIARMQMPVRDVLRQKETPYRDPVRSSHGHFVKASGLRWLSLMLLPALKSASEHDYADQQTVPKYQAGIER
jgi:hypothetical protein